MSCGRFLYLEIKFHNNNNRRRLPDVLERHLPRNVVLMLVVCWSGGTDPSGSVLGSCWLSAVLLLVHFKVLTP